jgi:hypothetical protein
VVVPPLEVDGLSSVAAGGGVVAFGRSGWCGSGDRPNP